MLAGKKERLSFRNFPNPERPDSLAKTRNEFKRKTPGGKLKPTTITPHKAILLLAFKA